MGPKTTALWYFNIAVIVLASVVDISCGARTGGIGSKDDLERFVLEVPNPEQPLKTSFNWLGGHTETPDALEGGNDDQDHLVSTGLNFQQPQDSPVSWFDGMKPRDIPIPPAGPDPDPYISPSSPSHDSSP